MSKPFHTMSGVPFTVEVNGIPFDDMSTLPTITFHFPDESQLSVATSGLDDDLTLPAFYGCVEGTMYRDAKKLPPSQARDYFDEIVARSAHFADATRRGVDWRQAQQDWKQVAASKRSA